MIYLRSGRWHREILMQESADTNQTLTQRKIPYTFFSVFCQLSTATDQSKGQLTNVTNALLNACMNIEWIRHKGSMQPFRPIHSVRTNRSRTDSDVDFRTTRSIRCSRYRWRRIHWICTKTQIYFSYLAIRRHNFDRNIGRLIVIDFCCRWNALFLVPSMHHQTVWFDESLWRTEKYWVSMKTNRFFFLKLKTVLTLRQISHWNGRSPVCVRRCILSDDISRNNMGQCSHLYGFSPVWLRAWLLQIRKRKTKSIFKIHRADATHLTHSIWTFLANIRSQKGHLIVGGSCMLTICCRRPLANPNRLSQPITWHAYGFIWK